MATPESDWDKLASVLIRHGGFSVRYEKDRTVMSTCNKQFEFRFDKDNELRSIKQAKKPNRKKDVKRWRTRS